MRVLVLLFLYALCSGTGCKNSDTALPVKNDHYLETEVQVHNPDDSVTLAGTLTIPTASKPCPAVLLIPGSGPHNRDEEILGHRPFLVLADHLARHGTAVLRLDKRGCGESGGVYVPFDIENFTHDALAGINYLKNHNQVDPSQIGVIGHSLGGLIAPILANESTNLDFMILLGAPGLWGPDFLCSQSIAMARAAGFEKPEFERIRILYRRLAPIITSLTISSAEKLEGMKILEELWNYMDSESRKILGNNDPTAYLAFIRSNNVRTFMDYDPSVMLHKINCPVLALTGDKDLQVPSKDNLAAIEKALREGGNKNTTIKEMPGLNHLLQKCDSGLVSEYSRIKESMSPSALNAISEWIKIIQQQQQD
jgi:uncharacterized protein